MAGLTANSRVFTFPASLSFIDALAQHVLKDGPEACRDTLLFLPSRRAATAFRDACLRLTDGKPLLLPRMFPLGDVDESEWFTEAPADDLAATIPPAIPRTRRHMLLAKLVAEYLDKMGHTPKADMEDAARLALELAALLDEVEREEVKLEKLRDLVPAELAQHWEQTLGFMQIIARDWPRELARLKMIEPAARRSRTVRALAEHWGVHPPTVRVIAAGSTGSQPATAALLQTIARLPKGEVILPALDAEVAEEAWREVEEVHPQYQLKRLLERLEIARRDVTVLGEAPTEQRSARAELLRAALLPPAFTHAWKQMRLPVEQALKGLSRVEAANPHEEARIIALLLRGTLEHPGKRAALITHDRMLARMVAAEMQRFDIAIDDSAGRGITGLPVAMFVQLVAEMAISRAAPVPLLSLLKHPLAAAGMSTAECRLAARELETALLRGVRSAKGFAAMKRALVRKEKPAPRALRLLDALEKTAEPLIDVFRQSSVTFAALLEAHLACAEALAATVEEQGAARLWSGEQGRAAAEALADIRDHARELPPIDPQNYPALLEVLLTNYTYRPAFGQHPRLAILSPIEARLQQFDRVILGGLNEGSWPPAVQASPWMSRPMQQAFGLPCPERQIGMAAHDFMMLACAGEVVLTRSLKSGGALTSPSRWLRRIDTLLAALNGAPHVWSVLQEQSWAGQMHAPTEVPPLFPPRPCPPVAARPMRFSISEIDRWLRDPYAIYAAKILGLEPLDPIDEEPGAKEFGTLLHKAIELFAQRCPGALPENARAIWMECAAEAFRLFEDRPAVRAFWWRRIERIADWLLAQEAKRRPLIAELTAEWKGERAYPTEAGEITIRTRIDRLESHLDGTRVISDYKTGGAPSGKQVQEGLAVQLPLAASIAGGNVTALEYWLLSGREYKAKPVAEMEAEVQQAVARAEARVRELAEAYGDPSMPYLASPQPHVFGSASFNDYEHLERKEEWEEG